MPSIPVKQMLEAILKGAIPAKDKTVFEEMWDAFHRYGGLSKKQTAWIESVYYKLPKEGGNKTGKTGKFASSDVTRDTKVQTVEYFKKVCPSATASEVERVAKFFSQGGGAITVTPK